MIIVPDKNLFALPFAVSLDKADGKYLIEKYEFMPTTVATIYLHPVAYSTKSTGVAITLFCKMHF